MVKFTQRQDELLQLLLANPTGLSMSQIETGLNSSRRTIYREFSNLELVLANADLKIVNEKHHFQLTGSPAALAEFQGQLAAGRKLAPAFDSQTRQNALACRLLMTDHAVKLKELALDFDVSVATISNDLTALTTPFADYELSIERLKSRGIQVAGTEGSIRNLFATILNNEINDYEFFKTIGKLNQGLAVSSSDEQSYFLNLLDAQSLITCYQAVRGLKKKYFASVPDGQLQQLIITLTTGIMRLQHQQRVTYLRGINRDDFLKYQRIALAIMTQLPEQIKALVTGAEIDFLAQQIKGLTFRIDQDASLSNYDLQLTYQVKQFIDAVATNFDWSFGTDDRLLNNLTAHMQIALQRNGVSGPVPPSSELQEVREQYPKLYSAVVRGFFQVFTDQNFTTDELTYLLIHFASTYEQQLSHQSLKVLVLCPNGMTTARILKTRLARLVPEITSIEVARIGSLGQIHLQDFDMILSTTSLPGFKLNYRVVSPLLLENEVTALREYIHQYFPSTKVVESPTDEPTTTTLDFDTVYQQMTVAKQILDRFTITPIRNEDETIAETLVKITRHIDPNLIHDPLEVAGRLLHRLGLAPVGIPNTNLALVHTLSQEVTAPYCAIFELDQPLPFKSMDNQSIRLQRIVLMLGPANISDFENRLMGKLSALVIESRKNTQTFMTGDRQQLYQLISTAFLNELTK
ncbi:PRD domain-containing protein [Lactobacillus pentosus]|jgi:mannitol operon transcriptional antiterminator|uniref:BglG family transcription antiterminator n=1 Tax=Lactiplantibacillus pentosus TaxID=1589 RepID=UPI000B538E43|nr:PRD domain-containing protein [Lactiplantibacillus pentosus]BBM21501.1 transcription regulator, mannitol operon [Lactiplantibacillus plantarum]ASG79625.1 transcription antiterminator BglG [Lactiplantibacillus pentosus]AYG39068.1 PRD domain-containing protein [Lactiplantibacillus pentosus]AYG41727.1 PRD domain-containing protein [Lactiplantibacillus pentosus]MCB5221373.1 helix-turn-helix domain-containing protein [Lactiplantibacillus pentosus]